MKRTIQLILVILFVVISNVSGAEIVTTKSRRLLIIHSYQTDYKWTVEEDQGITAALSTHFPNTHSWTVERIYLDGKKKQKDEVNNEVERIKTNLVNDLPDAAILTDDLAASKFYTFFKKNKIKTGVTGINGDLQDYGYSPGDRLVTGSLERYNILPSLFILKKLRPSLDKIIFVSDDTETGHAMLNGYLKQIEEYKAHSKLNLKDNKIVVSSNIDDLKKALRAEDPMKSVLVLVAYYSFFDSNGKHVDYQDIDRWLAQESTFLDIGSSTFQIENGRIISMASSGYEMGYFCADKLFTAILNNLDPGEFPIRKTIPLNLSLNTSRAAKLELDIPFEILAYANSFKSVNEYKK